LDITTIAGPYLVLYPSSDHSIELRSKELLVSLVQEAVWRETCAASACWSTVLLPLLEVSKIGIVRYQVFYSNIGSVAAATGCR
jgi:hypothetical protein